MSNDPFLEWLPDLYQDGRALTYATERELQDAFYAGARWQYRRSRNVWVVLLLLLVTALVVLW